MCVYVWVLVVPFSPHLKSIPRVYIIMKDKHLYQPIHHNVTKSTKMVEKFKVHIIKPLLL